MTTSRPFAGSQTNFNYGYGDLDRLVQATRPISGDPDETFIYDPVGNRLQRDGDITNNLFDDANRLLEDASFIYTYDLNGNTTSKTDKVTGEAVEYTYDPENRLIGFVERINAGGTITKTVAYRYDPAGRRIQKDVDGVITAYVYDGPDILFEYDGASVQQARYTHSLSVDEPLIMDRGGQISFYNSDGLGSITELADSTGTVVQAYLYDSFGQIIDSIGTIDNPYTYTGREFDAESGLYYYRARYYDPRIGRFINEDPIGFSGGDINLYNYVGSNPTNLVDANGLAKKYPKQPRNCNTEEERACKQDCESRGKKMQSCVVMQRQRMNRTQGGLGIIEWIDGPVSCSCDDPDDDSFCDQYPITCIVGCGIGIIGTGAALGPYVIPVIVGVGIGLGS